MTSFTISPAVLAQLSEKSRRCIQSLNEHQPEEVDLSKIHNTKRAAVLILLYEKNGGLRALLTTRAKTLRTHPGQTAVPGGKWDETDQDIIHTAYREAWEEVGLPMNHPDVHTVTLLRPFIAWTKLIVSPVIALLTNLSVLEELKPSPGEVELIFDHPLEAMLDPPLAAQEPLVPLNSPEWPSETEYYNYNDINWPWLNNTPYRFHRFRATAMGIKGLTAEFLIMTAVIGYGRSPSYTLHAPGQLATFNDILLAIDPSVLEPRRGPATEVILGRE